VAERYPNSYLPWAPRAPDDRVYDVLEEGEDDAFTDEETDDAD
jgi:hypothetical protein